MKCCLIVGVLILATLLPDEILAGRNPFKFGRSKPKTRSPSPDNDPAHRRPSSTAVTAYDPHTSHFAPGISASGSSSSLHSQPTRPGHFPLSRTSSGYSSGQPSSHASSSSIHSPHTPTSEYSSGGPSLHGSHQSLPPRSRSPSPGPSTPFARLHGSERKPSHHTDKGPRNTFKTVQQKHPAQHHPLAQDHRPASPTAGVHRPASPNSSNRRRSPSPKLPLDQLSRGRTPERTPKNPLIPDQGWPSPSKSEGRAAYERVDLSIIENFSKKVEVLDKEAGVNSKDTKRKQKSIRNMKKVLKKDDQLIQKQKVEGSGSRRHRSLERMSALRDENRACSTEKSAAHVCFDYYGFSIYWPPTVAHAQQTMLADHNKAKIVEDWVIHGLWPSTKGRNKDRPEKSCNIKSMPFNARKLRPIVHELEKVWFTSTLASNEIFWKHEFEEHGSCAARSVYINDALGYFKMGISLRNKVNMKGILDRAGFRKGTTMTYRDIYNAISRSFAKPHIEISRDVRNGKTYLNEIKVCYNHQFHPVDCATDKIAHPDIWDREISYLSKDEL